MSDGVRKVVLFGLLRRTERITNDLNSFGYSWEPGGCVIGGSEYEYWHAYNRVMIEAGRSQFGERFVEVLNESFT